MTIYNASFDSATDSLLKDMLDKYPEQTISAVIAGLVRAALVARLEPLSPPVRRGREPIEGATTVLCALTCSPKSFDELCDELREREYAGLIPSLGAILLGLLSFGRLKVESDGRFAVVLQTLGHPNDKPPSLEYLGNVREWMVKSGWVRNEALVIRPRKSRIPRHESDPMRTPSVSPELMTVAEEKRQAREPPPPDGAWDRENV